jgi:ribose transport system substrate-binding protein
MKRFLFMALTLVCVGMVYAKGSQDSGSAAAELPAADVAQQGFNYYSGAKSYNEVKASLGPIDVSKIKQPLTIGFTAKALENEFWRMEKEGAEKAMADLKALGLNITVMVQAAQGEADEQGQLAVFNNMVNRKYDAIMVSPIADGNLLPGVEKALQSKIPMVVCNDAFMPQIRTTVGAWHLEGAQLAADWVGKKINGAGEVAVIAGLPKNEVGRIRAEGFIAQINKSYPNVKVVGNQNADWDRTKAKEVADIFIRQFPNLKAIYAANDTMAMGVVESVRAAGKMGQILVVGCDGVSEALASIKAGELSATINNYPYYMSQVGIEMILRVLSGQEIPKVMYTPQAVVDKDNITKSDAEVINWTGFNLKK